MRLPPQHGPWSAQAVVAVPVVPLVGLDSQVLLTEGFLLLSWLIFYTTWSMKTSKQLEEKYSVPGLEEKLAVPHLTERPCVGL